MGGSFVAPASDRRFVVINTAAEETVGSAPAAATRDIDRAVAAAGPHSTAVRGRECPLWSEVPSS